MPEIGYKVPDPSRPLAYVLALLGAAAMLALSACATTSDPSQGGFLSGVDGLASGKYKQRAQQRSDELDRMREEQTRAQEELAAINSTLAQRQARAATFASDVLALDDAFERNQAEIDRLAARNAISTAESRALKVNLTNARARLAELKHRIEASPSDVEYAALKHEYQSILAAMNAVNQQIESHH